MLRLRRKAGGVVEVKMREQLFYSETGEPSFLFCVFDRVRLVTKHYTETIILGSPPQQSTTTPPPPSTQPESPLYSTVPSPPPSLGKRPREPPQHPQHATPEGDEEVEEIIASKKRKIETTLTPFQQLQQRGSGDEATQTPVWVLPSGPPDSLESLFPNSEMLWDEAEHDK